MTSIILKSILGLFVWLALPPLLLGKKKLKKYKRFINVVCTMLGVIILTFAGIDLMKMLLSIK